MKEFKNVTVVKKKPIYTTTGMLRAVPSSLMMAQKKTLGIILPGEYSFGTADKEQMEILAGKSDVLLPGSDTWETFEEGQMFEVPANSEFKISVKEVTDYCCSYIKE